MCPVAGFVSTILNLGFIKSREFLDSKQLLAFQQLHFVAI
jgi:hypothetical protein